MACQSAGNQFSMSKFARNQFVTVPIRMNDASNSTGRLPNVSDVLAAPLNRVYAQAIYEQAKKAGLQEALVAEFSSFVSEGLQKNPKLLELLASSRVELATKERVLDQVFQSRLQSTPVDDLLARSLKIIIRRRRAPHIPGIARQIQEIHERASGRLQVEVSAPVELGPVEREKIVNRLREATSAEPVLVTQVRPEMLGGLAIRIGDTLYDGSVATQLGLLRREMIQRSVHDIQSRRDRFGPAEGN